MNINNRAFEKLSRECFSDGIYDLPPTSFNKTNNPFSKYFTLTDNAASCQKVCASTAGCNVFMFDKSEKTCSIFQPGVNVSTSKHSRSPNYTTGPHECNTEAPRLVSYTKENCSESGVACVSGGSGPWEGLAHLGGRPICDDGWGSNDARVFCRQMGFRDSIGTGGPETFGTVRGPFLMNELQCRGTEGSILECAHESPVSNCLKWEGARVECLQFQVRSFIFSMDVYLIIFCRWRRSQRQQPRPPTVAVTATTSA